MRLGFEDQHVSVSQHARLRELLPDRIELVRAGGLVEAERAVKEPAEVAAIRVAARARRRHLRVAVRDRHRRAHGARGRARPRAGDAPARRARAELPLDRRLGRARRAAARRAARRRDRPGGARHARPRRRGRRLLLGLHPHLGDGRDRRRPGRDLRPRPARAGGGARGGRGPARPDARWTPSRAI